MSHGELVQKAKKVIADNFGVYLSYEYEKFYEDKDENLIISSLESLLSEALGSEPAKVQLKKYNIA